MMKLFFLIAFFLMSSYSLKADELPNIDQDFTQKLGAIKDPFEEGLPKPIVIEQKPIIVPKEEHKIKKVALPKPIAAVEVIVPPKLHLQGVIVGDTIHEAIIDDKIIPLLGVIDGARVISVSKTGVVLRYKGQKFFLKVE